jgi:hypothetical protein
MTKLAGKCFEHASHACDSLELHRSFPLTPALSACPAPQVGVGEREGRRRAICLQAVLRPGSVHRLFPLLGERVRVRGNACDHVEYSHDTLVRSLHWMPCRLVPLSFLMHG